MRSPLQCGRRAQYTHGTFLLSENRTYPPRGRTARRRTRPRALSPRLSLAYWPHEQRGGVEYAAVGLTEFVRIVGIEDGDGRPA